MICKIFCLQKLHFGNEVKASFSKHDFDKKHSNKMDYQTDPYGNSHNRIWKNKKDMYH